MSHTLYIIGNGFDLHHGIKSSYCDFYDYMVSKWPNGNHLSSILESFFPAFDEKGKSLLWCQFEEILGAIDEDYVFDQCKLGVDLEKYDNLSRYAYDIEDCPSGYLASVLSDMDKCFHSWIDSLDISSPKGYHPCLNKDAKDALFFTFNYTETLEGVYGINSNNICHIHGKRHETNYIYGHGNEAGLEIECDDIVEENAYKLINDYYLNLHKNVSNIISDNEYFFKIIKAYKIDKIIVSGCSLNDIDLPYFIRIYSCVKPYAKWYFSVFTPKDYVMIKQIVNRLGINRSLCHTFNSKTTNILTDKNFTYELYIENFG